MLEQRRAEEKGYITLKEAAKIANYTPDYVGQLIRAGKIRGEQVYSNVAWVTTPEEVESYLKDKSRVVATSDSESDNIFFSHKLFKYFLYLLISVCVLFMLTLQYILYVSIDTKIDMHFLSENADSSSVSS